ncbi:MAG: hypothetical protein FWF47_04175 [Clostridia bacterium]|nr:hypothetical protein [Clostridia bacterium]
MVRMPRAAFRYKRMRLIGLLQEYTRVNRRIVPYNAMGCNGYTRLQEALFYTNTVILKELLL